MMRRVLLSWILLTVCVLAGAQTARWSIKPIYSSIEPMDENIMKVKVGGKVGAITRSGKVLVEPVADSLTAFVEGKALALVSFTGAGKEEYSLMGILGQDESVKRPSQNWYVHDYPFFSDGLLPVYDDRGYYGYLDGNGKVAVPFKYMNVRPFCQGYAAVSKARPELLGRVTDGIKAFGLNNVFYIDKNGGELKLDKVIGTIDMGTSFYQGVAIVQMRKGGAYCSIGLDGKVQQMNVDPILRFDWKFRLSDEKFPEYVDTSVADGPTVFYEGGQIGYRTGNKVFLPPQFVQARDFRGGYALASTSYGLFGLLQIVPEGHVTCVQEKGSIDPGDGKESVNFHLTLPELYRNVDWKVICQIEGQPVQETYLFANDFPQRMATFTLPKVPRTVAVSVDGIIIYKGGFSALDPDAMLQVAVNPTSRRANAKDNFSFEVVLTNPGKWSVTIPVSISGRGLVFSDKTVTIPAGGKSRLSAYFTRVVKTETRSVTVNYGNETITKSITVRPIAGN